MTHEMFRQVTMSTSYIAFGSDWFVQATRSDLGCLHSSSVRRQCCYTNEPHFMSCSWFPALMRRYTAHLDVDASCRGGVAEEPGGNLGGEVRFFPTETKT